MLFPQNVLLLLISLAWFCTLQAQTVCDGPGQKPSKAFPVCGTSVFTQTTVPLCEGQPLPSPTCRSTGGIRDVNPYWYKFTCFKSGTLGFTITPKQLTDDYDWEVYDITGRDPNDIYNDGSLVISSNWSGEGGKTGAGTSGTKQFVCAGYGQDLYSSMPLLQQGRNYLLLISHFTQTQSGYDLEFKGGTAVITDSLTPHLKKAEAACSGDLIRVALNKKIKCSSIAQDGSDFVLATGGITITGAIGVGCSDGFDSDSLLIRLNSNLSAGTYTLRAKKGSDGNTLLDYCDNPLPETDAIAFTVLPLAPTPMDSLEPVTCGPNELRLIFSKPMSCASVASDGSDFNLNGPYPVTITGAKGNCAADGLSKEIIVSFSRPLEQKGDFTLTLKKGTDGNTLLDECTQETPAGSSISFSVKDVVSADFTYAIRYGCALDTIDYYHAGGKDINSWKWDLDDNFKSTAKNPRGIYKEFNEKNIALIVSNGFCSDTVTKAILLDNFLKADFSAVRDNCPSEPVKFTSAASGKITKHNWAFGDGGISSEESPEHSFVQPNSQRSFQVRYTVTDIFGCEQSIAKPIIIYSSCTVFIPNAFTPGNDGRNDVFRVLNAVKADKFDFKIYNRWGQLVYQTKDWKQGWDGSYKGQPQSTGTYIWMMRYIDARNNQAVERKGSFVLIR